MCISLLVAICVSMGFWQGGPDWGKLCVFVFCGTESDDRQTEGHDQWSITLTLVHAFKVYFENTPDYTIPTIINKSRVITKPR